MTDNLKITGFDMLMIIGGIVLFLGIGPLLLGLMIVDWSGRLIRWLEANPDPFFFIGEKIKDLLPRLALISATWVIGFMVMILVVSIWYILYCWKRNRRQQKDEISGKK